MKNKYLIIAAIFLFAACNKNIDVRSVAEFEPLSLDSTGGNWKTILLTNGGEVAIAPPDAVNSPAYIAELSNILESQSRLTKTEREGIERWKNSGAIRWNEKARELVAKYNLPPEANPDGTYPVPSAANPAGYPKFPFANPPYASRAYSYLSAATYDALVSCWKYKFQYNRMSPAINDGRLQSLETIQQNLPSYPSEDAVIAQVSYRLLKVLFPLDSVALEQMAIEHKKSKMLSGVASASDIAAGEAIANFVAEKALVRFRADGMGQSVGNPTLWGALESGAVAHGTTIAWKSLEMPVRPPMLPFFGNVRLWNITAFQRDSLRPGPPPAISSPEFKTAMDEVYSYTKNPSGNTWRIAMFWADGAGTYTPPGHWNEIAADIIAASRMNELRVARTLSLLNMAMADAAICCWDTKSYYYFPRPSQLNAGIKTIGLPNFPSYTSGHSTFSAAAATVLGYVFPQEKTRMEAFAKEASESRIYGGIHYRFDCEVGLKCGAAIGSFAVLRGKGDGSN